LVDRLENIVVKWVRFIGEVIKKTEIIDLYHHIARLLLLFLLVLQLTFKQKINKNTCQCAENDSKQYSNYKAYNLKPSSSRVVVGKQIGRHTISSSHYDTRNDATYSPKQNSKYYFGIVFHYLLEYALGTSLGIRHKVLVNNQSDYSTKAGHGYARRWIQRNVLIASNHYSPLYKVGITLIKQSMYILNFILSSLASFEAKRIEVSTAADNPR
jgi:hypothetical protein